MCQYLEQECGPNNPNKWNNSKNLEQIAQLEQIKQIKCQTGINKMEKEREMCQYLERELNVDLIVLSIVRKGGEGEW